MTLIISPGISLIGPTARFSPENLGFLLADVARLWRRALAQRLEGSELTFAQARVLFYVSRDPGLRQVELAARLEIQPITLARLLDPLDRRGLIERRRDPRDRRAWRIHLTPAADGPLGEIGRIGAAVRGDALGAIEAADIEALRTMLLRMWQNLSGPEKADSAGVRGPCPGTDDP